MSVRIMGRPRVKSRKEKKNVLLSFGTRSRSFSLMKVDWRNSSLGDGMKTEGDGGGPEQLALALGQGTHTSEMCWSSHGGTRSV